MNETERPQSTSGEQQGQRPGHQSEMQQQPQSEKPAHRGSGKLRGKIALITGGDSGIGRATSIAFAKEGAEVAIVYLEEHEDAEETKRLVKEASNKDCLAIAGDITDSAFCKEVVDQVVDTFGGLNVLVNNAGEQHPQDDILKISDEQLERTFRTNIFSMFYLVKAGLPYMHKGDTIINTSSVTAYKGQPLLIDYSSTKGAIIGFTRALALSLAPKGIRVNAVAPGPIWTPLIPSTFPEENVEKFGKDTPLQRPGQPEEVALSFVFLAADDSSYMTGQTLHPNGGSIVNG